MDENQKSTVLAALGQKFIELSQMTPAQRKADVSALFEQLARAGIKRLHDAQAEVILKTLKLPEGGRR